MTQTLQEQALPEQATPEQATPEQATPEQATPEQATLKHEEETLDARGLVCPLPVLKARKRLQSLASGSILRVLSDDANSLTDFRHFCTEQQHELLEQSKGDSCTMDPCTMDPCTLIVHRIRKG